MQRPARIYSPRLAHPEQPAYFIKEIIEVPTIGHAPQGIATGSGSRRSRPLV
jgi:hypothetical protein